MAKWNSEHDWAVEHLKCEAKNDNSHHLDVVAFEDFVPNIFQLKDQEIFKSKLFIV